MVDRNTFESITLKLDSFERFKEFLLWRRTLHGLAVNEDEAVFAGFYLRHGPVCPPKDATRVQFDANYSDVFEAEYFRRHGIEVEMPVETVGPPVWTRMSRTGDDILFEIDGKPKSAINLLTGESSLDATRTNPSRASRVGRNDQCPCGSGKKFKKCCLNR